MKTTIISVLLSVVIVLLTLILFPWNMMHWGDVSIKPSGTITVQGTAKMQVANQVAMFTAGVNSVGDNRDVATEEVNKKIEAIITALKAVGIAQEDIKTQNMNIYQNEELYYEDGRQKTRLGQWRVNNNIEIKIRDVNMVSTIANTITSAGANNVFGPNYSLDDTQEQDKDLLRQAIENAQEKAEAIASSTGKKLGALLTVTEGSAMSTFPFAYGRGEGGGGGGASFQPGSNTVQKDVTVIFELK